MENILTTFECAPNIALIKYWGKSNEELILPLNGSISVSLDSKVLCSKTSLMLIKRDSTKNERKIQIWINKEKQEFTDDPKEKNNGEASKSSSKDELFNKKRFLNMLKMVRSNCLLIDPCLYDINICSVNNFPTACGLASSASGFACLALCLSDAFKYKGDVTELARIGSGSACRSCLEGFVKWSSDVSSEKSIATMLYPVNHWPQMNILVLVLEDSRKDVSSTNGMRESTLTSDLLKHRVHLVESERLSQMQDFIREKDFNKFAKLVMRDSNNFHSICMDTYPPLFYLNDGSREIIRLVNEFNRFNQNSTDDLKVAYSFDAGPNCFLFVLDENLHCLVNLIHKLYFENMDQTEFLTTKLISNESNFKIDSSQLSNNSLLNDHFSSSFTMSSHIKYLIHSKVGNKPMNHGDCLDLSLFDQLGLPR